MKGKFNLGFVALWIIWGALFLLTSPHPSHAKEGGWERLKEKIKITKELHDLKLAPDKEAAVLAIEQKYAKERKDLMAALKKYREDLKAALAAATPDEAKIQDLVRATNAAQDKLLTSVKMERDEAMALMTPVQQGQFIMLMGNWLEKVQGTIKDHNAP
ncbi:MAG: periplasmic heavy metal sensor [Desulfobaccales bacterium]|jgi:Spy/CpxP family protein refolding chaperone